jgi:Domain of unknown function (DUF4082)
VGIGQRAGSKAATANSSQAVETSAGTATKTTVKAGVATATQAVESSAATGTRTKQGIGNAVQLPEVVVAPATRRKSGAATASQAVESVNATGVRIPPKLGTANATQAVETSSASAIRTGAKTGTASAIQPVETSTGSAIKGTPYSAISSPSGVPTPPLATNVRFDSGFVVANDFQFSQPGFITALRMYRPAAATHTSQVMHLWSSTGTLLATITFPVSGSGMQEGKLSTPVAVAAGDIFRVDAETVPGSAWLDGNVTPFSTVVPGNSVISPVGNGIYASLGAYPNQTGATWYGVDVAFISTAVPSKVATGAATQLVEISIGATTRTKLGTASSTQPTEASTGIGTRVKLGTASSQQAVETSIASATRIAPKSGTATATQGVEASSGTAARVIAPTVTGAYSSEGGVAIDVTGTNFIGVTAVTFQGVNVLFYQVLSPTLIRVVLPYGNTTTDALSVTNASGTGTGGTITRLATPAVTPRDPGGAPGGGTARPLTRPVRREFRPIERALKPVVNPQFFQPFVLQENPRAVKEVSVFKSNGEMKEIEDILNVLEELGQLD